jgi:hypothetical protein
MLSVCGALMLLLASLALFSGAQSIARAGGAPGCTVAPGSTIQGAVNNGCSAISVKVGTYNENVVVPAGRTLSITGVSGAGATIVDGGWAGSVFTLNAGANVTLAGLTIQHGYADGGGGIENDNATLTVNKCIITSNSTNFYGGGIHNLFGTVTVEGGAITDNFANYASGGIDNNQGVITLNNSGIANNFVPYGNGGGINNFIAKLTLNNTPVTGNYCYWYGGGIGTYLGDVTIKNSPLAGNSTSNGAGAIDNNNSTVALDNSPVNSNTATSGGGVFNNQGTLIPNNSPVRGNQPDDIVNN